MLDAAVLEALQHVQHLLYGEGRVRWVVVDALEVAVGLLLHLLRERSGRLVRREWGDFSCREGMGFVSGQGLDEGGGMTAE